MNFQSNFATIKKQRRRSLGIRFLILAPIAVFLAYEVATRSVAAYFAATDPEWSLRLRSTNVIALGNLAQDKLRNASNSDANTADGRDSRADQPPQTDPALSFYPAGLDAEGEAAIRSLAEQTLLNEPLNARAFRILGQLSDRNADKDQTRTLMQAAVRRSLRESLAVYWMMQDSYAKKDYGAALRYADVLLRTRPQHLIHVMPMLGQMAETEPATDQLKRLLANNPSWRPQFFAQFPDAITDARTPLNFLLTLRNSTNPPSNAELSSYVNFLIRHGFYDLAYYTWLQFLPVEQLSKVGRLFNGGFETETSGLPFDWTFGPGKNSVTKIVARPGGEHALFMQFGPGRVEFPGVKQLIVLPPTPTCSRESTRVTSPASAA